MVVSKMVLLVNLALVGINILDIHGEYISGLPYVPACIIYDPVSPVSGST
jgi:hypothetical protein